MSSVDNADASKIGLWAHSNGGMTAMLVLEASGEKYPTTLWAPVSKFFPYDVLYYTDEFEDRGKAIRKSLAELEQDYDVDLYSFDKYLDWIKAPLMIHQGLADEAVPASWTDDLVKKLKKSKTEVEYYTYSGADHDMKGSWDLVIQRDIEFFKNKFGE
jgi:dipeptidyl aminopeptidase/acylaminoacyl peptidase